jgi:hypothetical protein
MAVVTVRPDSTPTGAANFTIFGGAASINAALSDNNAATYVKKGVTGNGSVIVGFASTTLTDTVRVKQVRIRSEVLAPTAASRLRITPITRINGVNYLGTPQVFNGAFTFDEYEGAYFTSAPDGQAWDQDRIDGLRAQIQDLASGADLSSVYELFFDIETTTQPSVSVASPTGTITNSSKPEVSWTYSDADGSEQDYYQIKVFSSAQYSAGGFDPTATAAFWDSGVVASDDNTATIGDYLTDGTFRAYVRVGKTVSGVPFYSGYEYSQFIVNITPPTVPTLTGTYQSVANQVLLDITGATVSGSFDSQIFQVQRSDDSGSTWSDITGGDALVPDGLAEASIVDYAAPRGATAAYRVRAIGTLGENEVASDWSSAVNVSVTNDLTWWLKAITDPTLNKGSLKVNPGFESNPKEQVGVFRPIGRRTAVIVSSGLQGEDGEFKISTSGDSEFDDVWALATHTGSLLLQTPQAEQKYIRIVDRSYSRAGTVTNPQNEVTIVYVEVDG